MPLKSNDFRVLPSWIVCTGEFSLVTLVPYEDVVWVYKKSVNGATVVVEYAAYSERNGGREATLARVESSVTAQEADRLVGEIAGRTPLAVHGWSMELEASRPGMLQRFEQRRAATARRPFA